MEHEKVQEFCGGTIPFNFDELHYETTNSGEALIDCNSCQDAFAESEWHWIDTNASRLETGEPDIHSVSLECPKCGEVSVFR